MDQDGQGEWPQSLQSQEPGERFDIKIVQKHLSAVTAGAIIIAVRGRETIGAADTDRERRLKVHPVDTSLMSSSSCSDGQSSAGTWAAKKIPILGTSLWKRQGQF